MKIAIHPADLKSDKQLIIDTLFRFLTPLSDVRRFSWLYENNPHGQARAWIAKDDKSVIGMASAFPRRIYMNGHEEVSWVLGDFCISDQYRSLGPALMLQRACLAEVDSGAVAFCYDFPSATMMAVYKRLQIYPFGRMVRLATPLRIDRKIRKFVKSPTFNRPLSTAGNLLLRVTAARLTVDPTLTISLHKGHCGSEFADLARRIGSRYGICTQRSAEYLNWRYLANPLNRYEVMTARREGTLLGYAVYRHDGEDAMLVDLLGVEEETILAPLVDHGVAQMRARGLQTVSAAVFETHPWRVFLERHGFKVREVSPIVIYCPSAGSGSGFGMMKERNWLFMHGDRDS